ncbi:hypothetical protein, partial [Enterobacter asburiae]
VQQRQRRAKFTGCPGSILTDRPGFPRPGQPRPKTVFSFTFYLKINSHQHNIKKIKQFNHNQNLKHSLCTSNKKLNIKKPTLATLHIKQHDEPPNR